MDIVEFFDWHMKARGSLVSWDYVGKPDKANWLAAWSTWIEMEQPQLSKYCSGYNSGPIFKKYRTLHLEIMGLQSPSVDKPKPPPKKPMKILNEA